MSNVDYSFISDEADKTIVFQSKVTSFGIEHVTQKDLVSFYMNFSDSAYFDSGLLPVDGTGMLSIRKAGNHTQIGYQYAPGKYYINWGAYERDPNAAKIYVAQPYRIVIADILNGNLLGARTFYSPIPIQHPGTELFHVNLPNINCRGYRGNGVGWICLYHTEDIAEYPFNEKVAKILERCSGVEAYNDQNMSETDGPRFYRDYNKPAHVWDPVQWEAYTEKHGVEWTLDYDLWIPVLVQDADHQDKHVDGGLPLTYADAILGNYQAYYSDNLIPKPVNAIARGLITPDKIFNFFKANYNKALTFGVDKDKLKNNVYESSMAVRENLSKVFVPAPQDTEEDEDENYITCDLCHCDYDPEDVDFTSTHDGYTVCQNCMENENVLWVEHLQAYVADEDSVVHCYMNGENYHLHHWPNFVVCHNCGTYHPFDAKYNILKEHVNVYFKNNNEEFVDYSDSICSSCVTQQSKCAICAHSVPSDTQDKIYKVKTISSPRTDYENTKVCNTCYENDVYKIEKYTLVLPNTNVMCICGTLTPAKNMVNVNVTSKLLPIKNKVINLIIDGNLDILDASHVDLSDTEKALVHFGTAESPNLGILTTVKSVCPICYEKKIIENSSSYLDTSVIENAIAEMYNNSNLNLLYGTVIHSQHFF